MKLPRDSTRDQDDLPATKRLRQMQLQLPHEIRQVPKILQLIAEFILSPADAAQEAAASNQVNWLKTLLTFPKFHDKMDEIAQNLTEIGAKNGHSDVLVAIYRWWDLSPTKKRRIGCGRAHLLALENGNFDAFVGLQVMYNPFDMCEGLKVALETNRHKVVATICKNLPYSKTLAWGAEFGRQEVIDIVFQQPDFNICKWKNGLYRATAIATHHGYFDIVKFFNENCGSKMFQDDEEGDTKEENVEKEEEDHRDDEEDDEEDEQVPDSMCPLATAIKVRRLDIAKYLYNTNGYKPSSLETVVVGAANNGPLELVELFYDDGRYDSLSLFAFEFAAGAGNVEIMKFFLSKGDLDVASLEGAYVMAASFGKADVIRYLYSIKGFQPSSSSIQKALVSAAEEGYVDVVKMLTVKENFSSQVIEKAFASAATNNGITFKTVRDQAGVLEYLFAKGCISPCFIRRIFSDAASRSCLDVVKFLYAKGSIPPKMVTDACCSAYTRNGGDVMTFLAQTGVIPTQRIIGDICLDTNEGNIYSVECLSKSGCLSRDLLKKVSREKAGHIRVERFYRQHLRRSYPGPTVLVGGSDNKKTVKDITYDAHQLKCIRADVFPRKIRVLHHVMKMIDLFCMPLDVATMEAAATGQDEWLTRLLPQLDSNFDGMAKLAEITAASGCLEATKYLLSRYGIDTFDPLKQALKHGHYNIVKEICETMDAEMLLAWAVDHCEFEVVKQIYYMYQHRSETAAWELYEIMISAIRMGNFDIVKFLNENCDGELHDNGLKELEGFPLTRAIECGRIQIAKYLYRSNGCATLSIFESAYSSAAGLGSMELVKLFCRDKRCSTSLISRSFVVAAGGGQLAVMKYLQLHRDYDASILSDAFKQAAGCGQTEVVQQLYLDGYQPSLSTFDEAAIVAGGGGHLNIVKLLDRKESISEELAMKMFMSAAKDEGLRCDEIDDQVGVMKFLYAKGCITCNAIVEMFPEAAKSGCVDVMEFLFTTGSIPSDVMDEAFQNAADENCAEIVEFLYQTGKISWTVLEDVFMYAAQEEDMYVIECLYESGCNSQELLDRASRSTSPTSLFNLFLSHHSGK